MADYTLTVTGRAITLPQGFPSQISNTEGADRVKFNCDSEYSGYSLVAVFKNGERGKAYPVAIPADRSYVSIPSAPLKRRGWLYIGLFGVDGLKVLPTLWASPVEIKEGTDTGGIYEEESASLIPGLIERVADVEADVDELETAVDGLEDDVTEIDLRVGALEDDVDELEEAVEGKQDTIADLDTIRSGAAAGATALQSVPIATSSTIGGGKVNTVQGIGVKPDGTFYAESASNANITNRNNGYRPIVSTNMDLAFRTCITDPAQELTDEQKAAACATIGAEYKGNDNWENVAQLDATQTQFIIDLTGYTEICIESHLRAAQNVNLKVNNNMILFSNIAINGSRSVYAEWKDNKFGFCSSYAMRSSGYDIVTDALSCENQCYGGTFNISGINKFYLDATITEGSIVIYAR